MNTQIYILIKIIEIRMNNLDVQLGSSPVSSLSIVTNSVVSS